MVRLRLLQSDRPPYIYPSHPFKFLAIENSFMADMDPNRNGDAGSNLEDQKNYTSPDKASEDDVKEEPFPVDTIPNGGVTAWLQVFGSFFLMFNSWCLQPLCYAVTQRLLSTYIS